MRTDSSNGATNRAGGCGIRSGWPAIGCGRRMRASESRRDAWISRALQQDTAKRRWSADAADERTLAQCECGPRAAARPASTLAPCRPRLIAQLVPPFHRRPLLPIAGLLCAIAISALLALTVASGWCFVALFSSLCSATTPSAATGAAPSWESKAAPISVAPLPAAMRARVAGRSRPEGAVAA